jgi:hypothetical protein
LKKFTARTIKCEAERLVEVKEENEIELI